jgi:hypothetical protein
MQERLGRTDYSLPERKLTRERPRRTGPSASVSSRAAIVSFGLAELAALGFGLRWARGAWFQLDDWDYLSARTAGNLGDLFRPHYEHWVTLPILAYRLIWSVWGLNYLPYELFAIVLNLVVAALLLAVMRRAGVGPWVATFAASLFAFIGAGAENYPFTSALAFGFAQLLLADHDGPVNRRDYLGLGAGLAALLCSGVAVTMALVVGVAMLVRRGWRIALFHTAPLGAVYLLWLVAAPTSHGQSEQQAYANNPLDVLKFLLTGLRTAFARMGQIQGFGILLAGTLVGGLMLIYTHRGIAVLHGRAAPAIALLAGAIVFLVLTGVLRGGQDNGALSLFKGLGAHSAGSSRYTYVVVAMVLPAVALAVDAVIARWHGAAVLAAALLVVALPSHIHQFGVDAHNFTQTSSRKDLILQAARLPLAKQLPRSLQIGSPFTGGPNLGWLLDTIPSGRIPAPGPLTPVDIATQSLTLALQTRGSVARTGACSALTRPVTRVFRKGDSLALRSGSANVYLAVNGRWSQPRPLAMGRTVVALAGPLKLRLAPTLSHPAGHTVLCE